MKKLRKIYPASLLLLGCIIANGQKPLLDSICVQIDDNIALRMGIYEYSGLAENVAKDLKSLQSVLKDNIDIPEETAYSINYEPDELLTIEKTGSIEKIVWKNGEHSTYKYDYQCNISSNNYSLSIQYNELETLFSESLIDKIRKVVDTTNTLQGRLSVTYNYSFQGDNMIHDHLSDKVNGQLDALSLKGGVGANLIKNQPVVDLSAEAGLMFSKKGILKNQFYLSYNQLSDFSDVSKVSLNGFANIGYRYNLSHAASNPNWLGVELGYLTVKQGDLFEKNTFRLGVNWEIGKYMTVAPQLYFSGNSIYPAIRIGFGL